MIRKMLRKYVNDMSGKDWLILVIILIAALIYRIIFLTKMYSIGFDEVNYLKLAASGNINGLNHVLHAYWSPLYPAAVALFSYIIPDYEIAGRFLAIICSILLIVPLFFFIKKYYNKQIAFLTALLIAFYSFAVYFSVKAEAEFLYSFAGILGICIGWKTIHEAKIMNALWVGMLFGLCYLARPEGIGFLITFSGAVVLVILIRILNRKKIKSYILITLLAIFGFGVISSPYLLYLKKETGYWTISTKGTINQQGAYYVMNKTEYEEHPFHSLSPDDKRLMEDEIYHQGNFVKNNEGKQVVKVKITGLIKKVAENIYELFSESFTRVFPLPVLILFSLGLFGTLLDRKKIYLTLYLLSYVVFFWFILIPLFHITLRYFVPLLPIGLVWVAQGAVNFKEWLNSILGKLTELRLKSNVINIISIIITMSFILFGSVLPELGKHMKGNVNSNEEWAPAIEQKKAGLWLKRHSDVKAPVIMAYNHAVSFYAGNYQIKESIEIPENKIDRLLRYARHRGVDYIVLDSRYRHHHPHIQHLYENKDVPDELELIYDDDMGNGIRTLVYKLLNVPADPA